MCATARTCLRPISPTPFPTPSRPRVRLLTPPLWRPQWKGYTPDKSPLDQLPDRAYTWRGPGAPAPNPMDQLNTKPHVWKGPGPPAVNPMDQLDRTPYQVSCPTSRSLCAPPRLLPRAVSVACVGLGLALAGPCRLALRAQALPRSCTLARSLAPAPTRAPLSAVEGLQGRRQKRARLAQPRTARVERPWDRRPKPGRRPRLKSLAVERPGPGEPQCSRGAQVRGAPVAWLSRARQCPRIPPHVHRAGLRRDCQ
jgi:hypothetical protein